MFPTSTGSYLMGNFHAIFIFNMLFLKLNWFICIGNFPEPLNLNWLFLKLNEFNCDSEFS